ncbi:MULTISPECIES: DUF4136 domain-containing protein [Thiomicrorhabdus]|uniref:DUF4136 domain-containing protein n=1 Tax=Thiomicrorhabdus heinhorstiae TaxID=2748010 RepID=A0ABS0BUU9_9GAMM|nr:MULTISPECIES: DUF4136 domain-containing protein [Thiomicrorhabdus]MBF6057615.1 DUF4136 domain-containing protein [Thiomicrorhabdus heinhorstiae]
MTLSLFSIRTRLLLSLMFFSLLGGCSLPVQKDYDPQASFSNIKTLEWLPEERQVTPKAAEYARQQPLLAKRLQLAIANNLNAKGLLLTTTKPDAYITYHIGTYKRLRPDPVSVSYGFGGFWRHGGIFFETAPDYIEETEGSITVDILNAQGDLIWRSSLEVLLRQQETPQETERWIQSLVDRLLADFPPK